MLSTARDFARHFSPVTGEKPYLNPRRLNVSNLFPLNGTNLHQSPAFSFQIYRYIPLVQRRENLTFNTLEMFTFGG